MTRTEEVTKTAVLPLETSNRKNERVVEAIEEWQAIAGRLSELMPSLPHTGGELTTRIPTCIGC